MLDFGRLTLQLGSSSGRSSWFVIHSEFGQHLVVELQSLQGDIYTLDWRSLTLPFLFFLRGIVRKITVT